MGEYHLGYRIRSSRISELYVSPAKLSYDVAVINSRAALSVKAEELFDKILGHIRICS
jgi:hypothetical protein